MRVGELLKLGREIKGWTVRDVERETGISNALVSQMETGHVKDPSFTKVVRICEALGIPINRVAEQVSLKTLKEALRK
jgi:transcriptional regulator with XRE-family HTH domain